jgi:hypothetical protein
MTLPLIAPPSAGGISKTTGPSVVSKNGIR